MDPIRPVSSAVPGANPIPVERLERVSRERDRPARERSQGRRRPPPPDHEDDGEDGQGPGRHIDVRA